ncbi:hypothetical protein [Actinokineospora cianjurensis]|uniref:hypothetical protein n=1 Tax=Actinokineospora cianjurensis TaxID=585224 RepID=UPI0011C3D19B|nr:hypothetical protein [Actinokineospora cianjurensis]
MAIGAVLRNRNASLYRGAVVVSSFGSGAMLLIAGITGTVQLIMYAPNALTQALGAALVAVVDFRVALGVVGVLGLGAAGRAAWTVLGSRKGRSLVGGASS